MATTVAEQTDICECGHRLRDHEQYGDGRHTDGFCGSGYPTTTKAGETVGFGSMDWCTCRGYQFWKKLAVVQLDEL